MPQKDESSAFIFFRALDSSKQNRRQTKELFFSKSNKDPCLFKVFFMENPNVTCVSEA
ncbi:hypothetical protein ACI8B_280038 [Acinetobacter proteolyticus]|uniref:Uncharacterized protein n=1 Tax=Acinetobacter proteolyticus TaxID=1776741 RepID=A0A653K5H5_9GAMM|nr:hypothetical protein ACI8B_280038 [Acinetobacter proteolyticus]